VLHQSFAEFLCAWWAASGHGRSAERLRAWLRGPGALRLTDTGWHEVYCHLAALVPDATPMLDELWKVHRRSLWWQRWWRGPRDDDFGTGLCLAGKCLAAAAAGQGGPLRAVGNAEGPRDSERDSGPVAVLHDGPGVSRPAGHRLLPRRPATI
jgi:hypothetical protein